MTTQSQNNILTLAAAVRDDKKLLGQVCATAKRLSLPSPRKAKPVSEQAQRLQNFIRNVDPQDLRKAVSKFGPAAVFNELAGASILEEAARKFAEQALKKAGGA
jgi:hypothetical protein